MEVSNRIVIFSRGHLEQIGSPREVYEEPSNEFVARFIGVMNVLDAEVRGGVARVGELEFPAPERRDTRQLRIGFPALRRAGLARSHAISVSGNHSPHVFSRHSHARGDRASFRPDHSRAMTKEKCATWIARRPESIHPYPQLPNSAWRR